MSFFMLLVGTNELKLSFIVLFLLVIRHMTHFNNYTQYYANYNNTGT